MVWPIVMIGIGIYTIFNGVRTLITGTLFSREEAKMNEYTEQGAIIYKRVYAAVNIVSGLILFGLAAVRILAYQGVIANATPYTIIAGVLLVILVVIFAIVMIKCRK